MVQYEYITDSLDAVLPYFGRYNTFGLDLETTGLNPNDSRILLAQLGFPDINFVINPETVDLTPLVPYLNSWSWKKVIQNAAFETQFFEYSYGANVHNIYDTMLADQIIAPQDYSHSLETIALKYLDRKLNKTTRQTFYGRNKRGEFTDSQLRYAAEDAEVLPLIMEQQLPLLEEAEQTKIAELEFALSKVVGHMELVGIPINPSKWKVILEEYRELHEESRLRMNALIFDNNSDMDEQLGLFVRDGINLGSNPKLLKVFNDLGIDIEKTDNRTISLINHPLAKELIVYRKYDKILTSYGKTVLDRIHPFTRRVHPDFRQIGADTGRFSCREPNMQQIPERFRKCVGDTEGYKIVGADYSQMELRIIAELSQDERMLDAFRKGLDIHKSTASLMFKVPLENVTKEQRFAAKTINFGIAYGMGIEKLMDNINIENAKNGIRKKIHFNDAKVLKLKHAEAYPKLREWLQQAGEQAYDQDYSLTMYGRKRYYVKPKREDLTQKEWENQVASIKRKGSNTPIQGTNADITKLAMIDLHEELVRYKMGADIINQVHDEIVLLVRDDQIPEVRELVQTSMKESAETLIKSVPVVVDTYSSEVWDK